MEAEHCCLRAVTAICGVTDKNAPEALETRRALCDDAFLDGLAALVAKASPEIAANTLLCAAHQATYLLRRQLEAQEQEREILEKGGFTERLYAVRSAARARKSDGSAPKSAPYHCTKMSSPPSSLSNSRMGK